ncbi:GNAT family N-acetyltransferase [Caballeronia sp. Lep1P3]|uniref:GNAT family N-acetyltransferase n=1 Tax=Caballeronia sp. Lep1P3 TaxID=2878150 RepID=UPI001FD5E6D1|nr:GNAT family N-acetyltransferase [Caballeronia sp. Lep1P3]
MNTNSIRFETITTLARFESLRDEWTALWVRANGIHNLSFEYCLHSLKEVALPDGAEVFCIVGFEGERLVVAWALLREREMLWRSIRALAPDSSVPSEVLVEQGPEHNELIARVWKVLHSEKRADLLNLPYVRAGTELHAQASKVRAKGRSEPLEIAVVRRARWADWESLRQSLPTKSRKELDTCNRRLSKLGSVSVSIVNPAESSGDSLIDYLFDWKKKWAEKTGRQGNFFAPRIRNFAASLLRDPRTSGQFLLFALSVDDVPVAVNLVAVEKTCVRGMQAAFDDAYGKYTPGAILLEHVVKWAFDSNRDFDFGAGGGKYKSVWAGESSYACTDFRIATSQWGKLAFILADVRRWYRANKAAPSLKSTPAAGNPLRTDLEP